MSIHLVGVPHWSSCHISPLDADQLEGAFEDEIFVLSFFISFFSLVKVFLSQTKLVAHES